MLGTLQLSELPPQLPRSPRNAWVKLAYPVAAPDARRLQNDQVKLAYPVPPSTPFRSARSRQPDQVKL